jgi:ParB/RepB/Spo0J family partition protein
MSIELFNTIKAQAAEGTSLKTLAVGRSDMFRINPFNLHIRDGWNSREESVENAEHIDNLAQSIAEMGVLEPLTCYLDDGKLYITDGHCRLKATYRAIEVYGAEIVSIPVKTEPKGSSEADRLLSQIVRNSGKPLSQLELGSVCKRLQGYGWTVEQIAKKASISLARVGQLLQLHAAPEAIKERINAGEVSATLALNVVRSNSDKDAVAIIDNAVEKAKSNGKSKATAKDTGSVSIRKLMTETFDNAHIDDGDGFDDRVQVLIRREDWEKIVAELKQ